MSRSIALAVSAVVLTLGLAACASDSSKPADTASVGNRTMEDTNYRIGSRIPVKDSVSSSPTGSVTPSATGATPRIN
ncbi:MAG: hypothetical protein U1F54_06700 [Burkholderiales bacterium]